MPLETGAEWQPSETLPRDGRLVLALDSGVGSHSLVVIRWFEGEGVLADPSGREFFRTDCFTHWIEVPPLPAAHVPSGEKK